MNEEKVKWVTGFTEIASASNESLRRSLITCDGLGEKFKGAVLDELLRREREILTDKKNNLNVEMAREMVKNFCPYQYNPTLMGDMPDFNHPVYQAYQWLIKRLASGE